MASYDHIALPPVHWLNAVTGETKRYAQSGDIGTTDEWEVTALETALRLVPDLETIIDVARMQGREVEVHVKWR